MSIRTLAPVLQQKSENELYEKPNRLKEDLEYIKNWLAQQPHLSVKKDDQWLLAFLRGCKFSLERTKEKLDLFYSMRTLLPEFFSNRDPLLPDIQEALKLGIFLPLPKLANFDAPRVLLSRCEPSSELPKIPFTTGLKTTLMIIDILLNEDDNFIIAGQQNFLDMKGLTVSHLAQFTPSVSMKFTRCLENAYPTRPKGFHIVNLPSIAIATFNTLKSLGKEKIRNRIFVYGGNDLDKLYEHIPKSVLPKEYGGESGSIAELTAYWKEKVESYRDWFLKDEIFGSDETRRPGKSLSAATMFGVEGSFRKLEID